VFVCQGDLHGEWESVLGGGIRPEGVASDIGHTVHVARAGGFPSVNCINVASLCQGADCENAKKKQERHATRIARNSYDNA